MKSVLLMVLLTGLIGFSFVGRLRADDAPDGPPPRHHDKGADNGNADGPGPGGGGPGGGGPGNHRPGPARGVHLIPPFVADKLDLSDDQKKQIADLEKEVKAKLAKILTADQMMTLEETRPPRPNRNHANEDN